MTLADEAMDHLIGIRQGITSLQVSMIKMLDEVRRTNTAFEEFIKVLQEVNHD